MTKGPPDADRTSSSGICGEHGGDPASIQFFEKVGLDYVSCSPFRVPVARLAAAQAALSVEDASATAGARRDLRLRSPERPDADAPTGSSRSGSTRRPARRSGWISTAPTERRTPAPERRLQLPSAVGRRRAQRAAVSQDRAVSTATSTSCCTASTPSRRQHAVRDPRRRLLPRPQLSGDRARRRFALASTQLREMCYAPRAHPRRRARWRCCTASWTRWSTTTGPVIEEIEDRIGRSGGGGVLPVTSAWRGG